MWCTFSLERFRIHWILFVGQNNFPFPNFTQFQMQTVKTKRNGMLLINNNFRALMISSAFFCIVTICWTCCCCCCCYKLSAHVWWSSTIVFGVHFSYVEKKTVLVIKIEVEPFKIAFNCFYFLLLLQFFLVNIFVCAVYSMNFPVVNGIKNWEIDQSETIKTNKKNITRKLAKA